MQRPASKFRSAAWTLAALLALGGIATAQDPAPAHTFAVRCGALHLGDGRVLTDAVMIVRDGRIEAVGAGASAPEIDDGMTVLDASSKVVMPGIVAADSDLSGHRDAEYNVTPDFVALEGFDFLRERKAALSGGVTTAYLSPGRTRLISGQGSVIKLHGDDIVARVLAENACLRLNMGEDATNAPALFEPTPSPTADNPLQPAREQYPSARISILPELQRIFREALDAGAGLNGDDTGAAANGDVILLGGGAAEDRYAIVALQRAARGALPLRIAAREAADVKRALWLADRLGARAVLEDPYEIGPVAAQAARQGAAAVFRIPVRPGASNPGGEDRSSERPESNPGNPARAEAAGIRFALAPPSDGDMRDYLMVAGIAIRHGASPQRALRAITADAAAVLGVDDRVGTLARGKDADFLVLSGAPFAIGTMVEQTFVAGERAYRREESDTLLAVRVGEIRTMTGRVYRDAVLVAENGRIKSIGENLAIPYGARVLDVEGGVMVPGFIDAYSHLGLSGEGTGIPNGAADQRVADVIRHDDPLFARALEAGLTTVLVSGKDSGLVSGRVAAVKTGAANREAMIVKETAAIRFVHDGIGPDAMAPLTAAINRAKKYIETWKKYEKALADFQAGKGKKPKEEKPAEESKTTEDPITGTWELELAEAPPTPVPITIKLVLKLAGSAVTGSVVLEVGGRRMGPEVEIENGKFENGKLTAEARVMGRSGKLSATVGKDTMQGTLEGDGQSMAFSATRTDKATGGGGGSSSSSGSKEGDKGKDEAPKKPQVDENLEPLRALLEKRIPAIVRTNKAPAIESVVQWFTEQKLPFVLTGLDDAIETPDIFGEARPAVLLGPNVVRREKGEIKNAAATLSDRGMAVALGTGDTAGARYLPLHAALAVRYGMDPTEALKAMTLHAARMFKIDDRVGSLERGKDADFVVLSGSPFEMTSRVKLVVVNGKVVVDKREGGR